jgi:hypothetical protein
MTKYNPENQYRCTIIRGKSQSEMEDLLPCYANMVNLLCPCTTREFDERANRIMAKTLFQTSAFEKLGGSNQKTIRNHITEIAGTLLGLYYTEYDEVTSQKLVYESEACRMLREKMDSTLFFLNLCLNFQFPNGEKKLDKLRKDFSNSIALKPFCFVVAMLKEAEKYNTRLRKQEIGFYALNNLDVLRGDVSAKEVVMRIIQDRSDKVKRHRLRGSHDWQHIKEQFNLLELTNIIEVDATHIWLNASAEEEVKLFISKEKDFLLPPKGVNYQDNDCLREFIADWKRLKGIFSDDLKRIKEQRLPSEIFVGRNNGSAIKSTLDLGNDGEALVFQLEQERIRLYKPRLVNKVVLLGKTKGLGYDICSLEGDENSKNPEFARYIEVKTTRRVTEPKFEKSWLDSLNLTNKEWVAAQQYKEYYNIFRVYFTKHKTIVIRINDPYSLAEEEKIEVYPTTYKMNFGSSVIEKRYEGGA